MTDLYESSSNYKNLTQTAKPADLTHANDPAAGILDRFQTGMQVTYQRQTIAGVKSVTDDEWSKQEGIAKQAGLNIDYSALKSGTFEDARIKSVFHPTLNPDGTFNRNRPTEESFNAAKQKSLDQIQAMQIAHP